MWGLSCSTRDLLHVMWLLLLWLMDSLAVTFGLSCRVVCRIFVPQPGIDPMSPCFARWIFFFARWIFIYHFLLLIIGGVVPYAVYSPPCFAVNGTLQGKNTGVGCHSLLQGIFSTKRLNLGLWHCGQILYGLSHQGSPARWNFNHWTTREVLKGTLKWKKKGGGESQMLKIKLWIPQWLADSKVQHITLENDRLFYGNVLWLWIITTKVKVCVFIKIFGDFPGGPAVKTLGFHCRGMVSIPGHGTKIPPCCMVWTKIDIHNLQKIRTNH